MSIEKGRDVSQRAVVAGAAAGMASTKGLAAPVPAPEPYLSLRAVARRIAMREVSPVELTQRMLARIAKADPVLKSYATVLCRVAYAYEQATEWRRRHPSVQA